MYPTLGYCAGLLLPGRLVHPHCVSMCARAILPIVERGAHAVHGRLILRQHWAGRRDGLVRSRILLSELVVVANASGLPDGLDLHFGAGAADRVRHRYLL